MSIERQNEIEGVEEARQVQEPRKVACLIISQRISFGSFLNVSNSL